MADARSRTLTPLGTSAVLNLSQDLKVLHFVNISVMSYLADTYFGGDLSRIVYASNAYAFRRRIEQAGKATQGLALPFANLRIMNVQPSTQRPWRNARLASEGLDDYNLLNKIRMVPITISFDATLYFSTELEALFSMSEAIWDASLETKITSSVDISFQGEPDPVTHAVPSPIVYSYDNIGIYHSDGLAYNSEFMEKDWLEKSKIRAIPINPTLETWLWKVPIGVPSPTLSLSKNFIFQLYENNDKDFVNGLVEDYDYLEDV